MFFPLRNIEQPADILLGMCPTRSSSFILTFHYEVLPLINLKGNSCIFFTLITCAQSHPHNLTANRQILIRHNSVDSKPSTLNFSMYTIFIST